jgi:hypothetical protein
MRFFTTMTALLFAGPLLAAPAPRSEEAKLQLRLTTATPKVKDASQTRLEVSIVNCGKKKVPLVQPGDGSDCGWRTPIIEWVIDGKVPRGLGQVDAKKSEDAKQEKVELKPACLNGGLGIGRCGNINSLRDKEVFELGSNKEVKFNEWVGVPSLTPGKHKVAVRYFNIPDLKWQGLGRHDATAMARVKESYKVTLESNTVEIVVGE